MASENPQPAPENQPVPDPPVQPAVIKPVVPIVPKPTPEQMQQSQQIAAKPITRILPDQAGESLDAMDRRTFVKWLTVGWAAFAAILGGYGSICIRFLFPNVLFEPKQSFLAGYPDDYPVNEVSERWKDKHAVWIVRDTERIFALSTVCTHLGCTPNWLPNEAKYKCPCHGSGFYKTGINFEGPAPRPLERFKIYLADNGEIVVDKTKKFQQEKGEWKDSESFILV